MIDNKKIKEAAIENADCYYEGDDISEYCISAFKAGIKWFKENLWHDASEEPKGDGEILVLCGRKVSYTDTLSADFIKLHGWNNLAEDRFITRWLYIEDLVKGGEK